MGVALQLVHRWKVVRERVAGLAKFLRGVGEPAVATKLARRAITARFGAKVSGEVLELLLVEAGLAYFATRRGPRATVAAATLLGSATVVIRLRVVLVVIGSRLRGSRHTRDFLVVLEQERRQQGVARWWGSGLMHRRSGSW